MGFSSATLLALVAAALCACATAVPECHRTNGSSKIAVLAPKQTFTNSKQCVKRNGNRMVLTDFECVSDNPDIVATATSIMEFEKSPNCGEEGFTIQTGASCVFKNVGSKKAQAKVNVKVACLDYTGGCKSGDCVRDVSIESSNSQVINKCNKKGTFIAGYKCFAVESEGEETVTATVVKNDGKKALEFTKCDFSSATSFNQITTLCKNQKGCSVA